MAELEKEQLQQQEPPAKEEKALIRQVTLRFERCGWVAVASAEKGASTLLLHPLLHSYQVDNIKHATFRFSEDITVVPVVCWHKVKNEIQFDAELPALNGYAAVAPLRYWTLSPAALKKLFERIPFMLLKLDFDLSERTLIVKDTSIDDEPKEEVNILATTDLDVAEQFKVITNHKFEGFENFASAVIGAYYYL